MFFGVRSVTYCSMVVAELKRIVTEEILPRGPSERMAIHGRRIGRHSRFRGFCRRLRPPSGKSARHAFRRGR
jgi:hypothetical protein